MWLLQAWKPTVCCVAWRGLTIHPCVCSLGCHQSTVSGLGLSGGITGKLGRAEGSCGAHVWGCVRQEEGWGSLICLVGRNIIALFHDRRGWSQRCARGNLAEEKEKTLGSNSGLGLEPRGVVKTFPFGDFLNLPSQGPEQTDLTWSWTCSVRAGGWTRWPPESCPTSLFLILWHREKPLSKGNRWSDVNVVSSRFCVYRVISSSCSSYQAGKKRKCGGFFVFLVFFNLP